MYFLPSTSRTAELPGGAHDGTTWRTLVPDLEKRIPELLEQTNVPGLSIAIVQDAKLVWRRGFGVKDNESKAPVDNDTVFEAGSMSKPVFAYAVMKLCEKGVLELDTPLTKYTSDRFIEDDSRLDLITPRHVLSHTSGFQNWRSKDKPLKIYFTPGEKYHYSGEGYFYLQSVVTRLTGHVNRNECSKYEAGLEVCATDIDDYMKANLLVPFGMASSGYVWNDTFANHAARPHDAKGTPLQKRKPKATTAARYGSAGGLHSTPTDYARFLIEVIDPKPADAFRLNKDSLAEMIRPHVKVPNDPHGSWALGWAIQHSDNGNIISHGGYNPGFHSFAAASPQRKAGYVLMTNGDNAEKILKELTVAEGIMTRWLRA
jgi:CubicO group peptidase (beta-lactamase class C family)